MSGYEEAGEAEKLWERVKLVYISTLPTPEEKSQADRYFSMITKVENEGTTFRFFTSNPYAAHVLTEGYTEKLKGCFSLILGRSDILIEFKGDETAVPKIVIPESRQGTGNTGHAAGNAGHAAGNTVNGFVSTMPLREDYTFDEFVEGPSNSWAYAAAMAVVSHPGEKGYNPLFIHGGTGLGKTHLMQAIGNKIISEKKNIAVCYLTAEMFLNEYVNALQIGKIDQFREKYRNIDVLLVDDVQFFQKGKLCQEEFFNTFNYLQGKNKQIVMTSDVAPKNLPALEERLVSRFIGGMVQEIESPSYETRLAILKKKSEGFRVPIPNSILEFIADNIKSHVRAMEGALTKVKVIVENNPLKSDLTPLMLSRLLKDFIDDEQAMKKMTIAEIQAAVARKYGVTVENLLSSERTQSFVTPRQLAMYISRCYTYSSLEEIGKQFEKKHATILHGVKTIKARLDNESELRETLRQILNEFGVKETDVRER